MKVKVKLYATLRRYFPEAELGESTLVEISEGATVSDLLKKIGIPKGETKIVLLNANKVKLDQRLREGDLVVLFPPIGGG